MGVKKIVFDLLPKKVKQRINQRISKEILEKKFSNGYSNFLQTGQTAQDDYMSLVDLYCLTNGHFNEEFNTKLNLKNPPEPVTGTLNGAPGSFSKNDFEKVNKELNENGYFHFEKKLSKEVCQRLYNYALQTPAKVPPKYDQKVVYNPEKPVAEIYRFDMLDQINNRDIQELIMDPVLINIARNYLGCEPIFDFPAMWWSTSFQKEASDEAAQRYHFDLDRIKWLKMFFYINDVTPDNGPHCYVRGSHKPGAKPAELIKRGYVRIPDTDIFPFYKPEDIKVVCGEEGSMFAGDTKCWHKGTPLKKGHRLVLELEYTTSLFGANYPKLVVQNADQKFIDFCKANKVYSSNIHFN